MVRHSAEFLSRASVRGPDGLAIGEQTRRVIPLERIHAYIREPALAPTSSQGSTFCSGANKTGIQDRSERPRASGPDA